MLEIRTPSHSGVRFHWVPLFALQGTCQTHANQVDKTSGDIQQGEQDLCIEGKDSYVHHWITGIHGEDSRMRQDPLEALSMAPETSLETHNASEK